MIPGLKAHCSGQDCSGRVDIMTMVWRNLSPVHFFLQIQAANLTKPFIKTERITSKKLNAKTGVEDGLIIDKLFFVGAFIGFFAVAGMTGALGVVETFEVSFPAQITTLR